MQAFSRHLPERWSEFPEAAILAAACLQRGDDITGHGLTLELAQEPRGRSWLSPSACGSAGRFEEELELKGSLKKENMKGLFSLWI